MQHLWFYKHQHDNPVRSTLKAFSLPFAAILVDCAPGGEMHNYCTPHIINENFENFLIHCCNYILLSQVYCVSQVVKTPTIILNNPVYILWTPGPWWIQPAQTFPLHILSQCIMSQYIFYFKTLECTAKSSTIFRLLILMSSIIPFPV